MPKNVRTYYLLFMKVCVKTSDKSVYCCECYKESMDEGNLFIQMILMIQNGICLSFLWSDNKRGRVRSTTKIS